MNYDLHIHSGLSPCAEDEMSPNNIAQMAKLHHIDLISVCDHNCLLQQETMAKIAKQYGLRYWYGVELTSKEEVHLLAYFNRFKDVSDFQKEIDECHGSVRNKPSLFGHQWIYDENDLRIKEVQHLLLQALPLSLDELIQRIHKHYGKAVLAHIYGRENGIIHQLGFIPSNLAIDGIEIKSLDDYPQFKKDYPNLLYLPIFINSDAHRLVDIIKPHQRLHVNWFDT